MDIVLSFFTDTLSGYVYVITTVISIILILGIIGFLSERKFNLENNHILTRNYNKENENEIILGDRTLYDKGEEIIAHDSYIPQMNQTVANTKEKKQEEVISTHKDEVI